MSEDEQKAWQEDNHYFMDNNSQYVKDAVIVAVIFGVCVGIVIGVAVWNAMQM